MTVIDYNTRKYLNTRNKSEHEIIRQINNTYAGYNSIMAYLECDQHYEGDNYATVRPASRYTMTDKTIINTKPIHYQRISDNLEQQGRHEYQECLRQARDPKPAEPFLNTGN